MDNDEIKKDKEIAPKDGDLSENFQIPYIDPTVYTYKQKKKVRKSILIAVAAVIVMIYVGGVIYHAFHFGTNTYINEFNVSGMTFKEADKVIADELNSYQMTVNFKNGQETIKIGDGDLNAEAAQSAKSLRSNRSPFLWFVDVFTEDSYELEYVVSYDSDKMLEFLSDSKYMDENNMEPSTDAKVIMKDGEVVIIPDVTGTVLDVDMVMDSVCAALDEYESEVNLEAEDCYVHANITSDSRFITEAAEAAEEYLSISACFDFDGYIYQIPREELSIMGYVDSKGKVKISQSNVYAYAKKLADKFSTSYTDRVFKTHDGRKILVYGGYYGWILDPETEGEELYEYMLKKSDFTKEPACEKRGYAYCEDNDIGYNYVEVDLSDQKVYLFVNGKKVLETDCVTGHMPGHKTPGGLYGVTYRALDVTLKGADYESKVTYWMPFNGDIGLHDATWRSTFGDDIYTYDGSHGCVNLPYSAAATIFDNVEAGFPVVCYWDDEVETVEE